jgi:hypothetical protein
VQLHGYGVELQVDRGGLIQSGRRLLRCLWWSEAPTHDADRLTRLTDRGGPGAPYPDKAQASQHRTLPSLQNPLLSGRVARA